MEYVLCQDTAISKGEWWMSVLWSAISLRNKLYYVKCHRWVHVHNFMCSTAQQAKKPRRKQLLFLKCYLSCLNPAHITLSDSHAKNCCCVFCGQKVSNVAEVSNIIEYSSILYIGMAPKQWRPIQTYGKHVRQNSHSARFLTLKPTWLC